MAEQLDLLDGAEEIAAYLGWKVSSVYHQAPKLPITRVGVRLIGSKSRLRKYFDAECVPRDDGLIESATPATAIPE
jgi:hypothetical protein